MCRNTDAANDFFALFPPANFCGFEVNQNTTFVTLGRIKKDGGARLDGRLWFHVSGNGSEETADVGLPSRTQATEGGDEFEPAITTS